MVELVRSGRNPEEEFDARLSETGHCVSARVAAMGFPVSWETLQEEGERVNHKRVAPLAPAYLSRLAKPRRGPLGRARPESPKPTNSIRIFEEVEALRIYILEHDADAHRRPSALSRQRTS
jgi:hypothetical protein